MLVSHLDLGRLLAGLSHGAQCEGTCRLQVCCLLLPLLPARRLSALSPPFPPPPAPSASQVHQFQL